MAVPSFAPAPDAGPGTLSLLLAPEGQLSGDGQLRELFQERRERRCDQAALWYLPPAGVRELGLAGSASPGEAVVAADPAVITWLQLRFGGQRQTASLSPSLLTERAGELPPGAPEAAVGTSQPKAGGRHGI